MNPADSHRAFMYGSHPVLTVIGAVVSAVAAVWAAGGVILLPGFVWRRWLVRRAKIVATREVEAAEAAVQAAEAVTTFAAGLDRAHDAFAAYDAIEAERAKRAAEIEAQANAAIEGVINGLEALLACEESPLEDDQ